VRHNTKYPAVGAVLEIHTTEEPSTSLSQYGESELDSLPKRSQITKAWLHVHRHDPTLEAPHHNEDFKQPDSWTPEFAEKINKPNPVPYYKQNTLLSTTPIQVPKGKKQASLDLTAFFREAASGPLIFYPAKHGGKYHLTDAISETARCRATVEVDRSGETIHVQPDQERIHPIICKRCLDSGRAAQGKGKHVSGSKASDYRFEHEQHFTGDHRIDAWHKSGEHAGFAEFAADGGLDEIEVNPEHQRKGVATGIWEHAKSVGINPQHSNVRSSDGDEWAHSTGDPVPENEWKYPNSFSTAFTAPGYHHPYTSADFPKALGLQPKSPRQAALHDISKPKYVDSYYMSDEEKEKAREQSQKDYDDFHAKIKEEAGLPADTDNYQVKKHWDRGMKSALTKGDISIDDAEQRGYHGDAREHGENLRKWDEEAGHPVESRHGGWQNLASHSDKFYHVSTNADAAAKEGLKTRHELNQGKGGAGLGGGSDDTVSVTSDRSLAPDIYHSLHEHHAVVTGKIKPEQLHEYAKNPPHGQPFDHMLVHKGEDGKMSADEQEFDQVKRGVINNGYSAGGPSWGTFKSQDEVDKAHPGEGWKPAPEGLVTGPEHPRHPLYNRWERPATEDEKVYQRSQFYKKFSAYRHSTGKGHRDPLFMSNDPVAFSKADPSRFGILHLKPHPKAQGYPLHAGAEHHPGADSGEWRLGSGSPFDVTHVERPTPRHLEEFGDDHKTASKDDVWYHGTDAETATKVRQQGDFSGYENKAKGSRVWGKGVYMAKDPSETARFGEHQVAVSHGMKNPFVLTHEHGFPGPFTVVRHLSPESQDVFDEQHASFSATARPGSGGNSAGEALRMALQHEGHDGVIFPGDNDTDWAVNYRPENVKVHRQDKTSAVRDVRDADSDAGAQTGIMVAIAPPASVVKNIAVEEGEAPKQIHLTLAYLGDTADYADDVVANLPEVIEAWAEGTQKFQATTQGAGTFVKSEEDGQHVLWAAVDAPGLHRIHTDLVDYLREHDFKPREDHSFTPHMTLAYGKHHFRFIPKIERQTWTVDEVWCCIGGIWQSFPLSG
jgi:2'-5' RNA ligase